MTIALKIAAALLAVYGMLFAGAYLLQRRLIYFPDPVRVDPASIGLAGVEEVVMATPDGERIVAWFARAKPGAPTILYFHGNAGSLESRSERIRKYVARGFGVFMMTYRGFGGSTGAPSERANVADAKLAYETLVGKGIEPAGIIVYGESLGSGVATQVAAEKEVAALVLDAPYTSMIELAARHHPYIPARWLMTDRYETLRHIGNVTAPLLILHGEVDDIIPVSMGRAVHEAANGPKEIATFPGAGHSDHHLFGSYDVLYRWLGELRTARVR